MKWSWSGWLIFTALLALTVASAALVIGAKGILDLVLSLVAFCGFSCAAGYAAMRRAS